MAEVYELFVAPLSRPIFEEVLAVLRPGWRRTPVRWTPPAVRVVSSARSHNSSHTGEVVGVDLAAGMVAAAARAWHAHGLDNTAYLQADVGELPDVFNGSFDLVYSVLAHHHFPDSAAAAGAFRCIRPGGLYAVIDPGPAYYNRLAAPLANWADPGWIGFTAPEEFDRLLLGLYWLTAGYALRASRALATLALLLVSVIVLLTLWGLPSSSTPAAASLSITGVPPAQRVNLPAQSTPAMPTGPLLDRLTSAGRIERAARTALGAVVFRDTGQQLTTPGRYIEMAGRLLGPVLLALTLLSIRNRVKR
jgi:hypothetical protein